MANEILETTIADLIASEELAGQVLYLLGPRNASLLRHPALMSLTHQGMSNVVKVPHLGLAGYDEMADHTPGAEVANTALTDGSTSVTLAPVTKRYTLGDFAGKLAAGLLNADAFALDLVISYQQKLISKLANVGDDFTQQVGSTGVDLSWDAVIEGKGLLRNADAEGEILSVVHPEQWNNLEAEAMTLGYLPSNSMSGVIMQGLGSYKGRYMGVDFFTSTKVPTANAGADRAGFMATRGGLVWADVNLGESGDPNIRQLGNARLERVRRGTFLETAWVQSGYMGVAKAIDACGVALISDA